MLYQAHLVWARFKLWTSVVIGTDCIQCRYTVVVNPNIIPSYSFRIAKQIKLPMSKVYFRKITHTIYINYILHTTVIFFFIYNRKTIVVVIYDSWIYNYLCNQCLHVLSLKLWVWTQFMVRCTRYNIMVWSLSVMCDWLVVFSGFLHQ